MKNIPSNFPLLHCRHFLKTGRNSFSFSSVKCFSNFIFENRTLKDNEFQKKNLILRNTRCLFTSVNKLDKSMQAVSSQGKNSDISIIYYGSLTPRVKGVKVFTCLTSIAGIIIQPLVIQNVLNGKDLPVAVALMSCLGFFTFVTPFICHWITRKYVTEIWYNSTTDTYTATLLSFFLRKITIDFKISDITVPDVPPVLTNICVKGKPILVLPDSFFELSHYKKMMGYDKPFNPN